jgi:hypothetical protein
MVNNTIVDHQSPDYMVYITILNQDYTKGNVESKGTDRTDLVCR